VTLRSPFKSHSIVLPVGVLIVAMQRGNRPAWPPLLPD
jgi:hypothetical protein